MLQLFTVLAAFAGEPAPAPAPAAAPAPAPADCSAMTGDAKVQCEKTNALTTLQAELQALGDCTKLTADAKTTCDGKTAELNAKIAALQPPAPTDGKSGKATRSNTNRMEAETDNE